MDVLVSGLGLLESPRWHDGRLWFADWTAGEIRTLRAGGGSDVVVRHASLPLCFDFLPDGTPLIVSNPQRALLRVTDDGSLSAVADLSTLSAHGCNDIVVDARGNAYVNSANFDFAAGPPAGERAPGLVGLVTPDGAAVRLLAGDLDFPNGMAVTPDDATLIVAESYRSRLTAFDIAADGSLGGRRVWADLGDGVPDGICVDADGAVWYADVPNRRCVRVAEGGTVLGTVELDRGGFACMLGGADGTTLYAVAAHWPGMDRLGDDVEWDGQVVARQVDVPHAGWPGN